MEYLDNFTSDFFHLVFIIFLIFIITSTAMDIIADFINAIKRIGKK